jgi:uncharacterized protein
MQHVTLQDKIAHLARPDSYPDGTARVEVVETHMSMVFLTGRHVYKLKKPVTYPFLDFGTLGARRIDCLEEVRLNATLAPGVYLGVVPLCLTGGRLVLEGARIPVEWLVKMRRLPRESMLDDAIARGTATAREVEHCIAVLAGFYRHSPPASIASDRYVDRLLDQLEAHRAGLTDPEYGLPRERIDRTAARLARFVRHHRERFEVRVRDGKVVDGHGDLRPEHVCLRPRPLFIDRLEFNRELRVLDAADEVAYLALECEHTGGPEVGAAVLAAYRRHARDDIPDDMVACYQSTRALLRAKISAWHLQDGLTPPGRERWLDRAGRYLAYACARSALLGPP